MKAKYKELQVVELVNELPEKNLAQGMLGTIIDVYDDGDYEVEFVNDQGNELLGLVALNEDQIRPVAIRSPELRR